MVKNPFLERSSPLIVTLYISLHNPLIRSFDHGSHVLVEGPCIRRIHRHIRQPGAQRGVSSGR